MRNLKISHGANLAIAREQERVIAEIRSNGLPDEIEHGGMFFRPDKEEQARKLSDIFGADAGKKFLLKFTNPETTREIHITWEIGRCDLTLQNIREVIPS